MKRTILLLTVLICFSVFNNGMAQQDGFLLDSVRKTIATGYGPYTSKMTHYYYNLFNQLKFDDVVINRNSFPDTADWYCTQKNYHFYDAEHRIIQDSLNSREANETDWTSKYKKEYYYGNDANIKTTFSWDFTTGSWNNGNERYIDTISAPEDYKTSFLRQYWFDQTAQWENDYWVDSLFFPDGLINLIKQTYWLVGDPDISVCDTIVYDYTYYPDTLFTYQYENNNGYYFLHKIYYTNDSSTKYNFKYRVMFDNTVDTLYKTTWYYDDDQHVIKRESAWWHPDLHDWLTTTTITYQYNQKGLLVQKDIISGDHQQTKYSYNDDDLLWKEDYYPEAGNQSYFITHYYYYTYTYVGTEQHETGNEKELLFYPNPAERKIYFTNLQSGKKQYRIYDVTGRMLQQGKLGINQNSIDISGLIPGSYFAIIHCKNQVYNGKFIKY